MYLKRTRDIWIEKIYEKARPKLPNYVPRKKIHSSDYHPPVSGSDLAWRRNVTKESTKCNVSITTFMCVIKIY